MMYPNKIQILKNALSPKKWENYKRFFQLNILINGLVISKCERR